MDEIVVIEEENRTVLLTADETIIIEKPERIGVLGVLLNILNNPWDQANSHQTLILRDRISNANVFRWIQIECAHGVIAEKRIIVHFGEALRR